METESATSLESDKKEDSPTSSKTPKQWHDYWHKQVSSFLKRARKFRSQGNDVVNRFLDEEVKTTTGLNDYRVNLFHSNVSMMQSMLYGSTPKVDVSREHQDPDDDVGRVAAVLISRILEADIAATGEGLPEVLKATLQDRLLPGLGVCRVFYEAQAEEEKLTYECVKEKYIHWQDFAWGWARTWETVPWVAYREWLTKDEISERFSDTIAAKLEYEEQQVEEADTDSGKDNETAQTVMKAAIWEIWDKETEQVFWYSNKAELILDRKEDPLGLDGFFPNPKPMAANVTTRQYMPKADFMLAQDLYNEVDVLQSRISTITRAVKVVGVYDKSSDGIKRMFSEGCDNDLIPVDNWAMFAEKGGIAGQIDWLPIDQIGAVLDKLRQEQAQTKQLLFEVTGLSDLLRGANTDQYTSDGTNQLTAKFGSIRIQALQDEFARFASDLESLKAEVISKHYSPETIYKQSSANYIAQADIDKLPAAIQLIMSPELKWRVNIKPESIAMVDYAQLKAERTEYLTSVATFLQSAAGLVQTVPGSMPVLLEMLKWGMAGFKGSDYLEGTLDRAIEMALKSEGQQQEDPEAKKAQAEMQKAQMELQGEMQKIQAKLQADLQIIQAKSQAEMQKVQTDHQTNMAEIQAKGQADLRKIMEDMQSDIRVLQAKLQVESQLEISQAENAAAEMQVEHENNLAEMQVEHEYNLQEAGANAALEARRQDREADTD